MTVEGWIFMVGLRVVDIGALVVWLVWFYRQSDEDDDERGDDDFRGEEPVDQPPPPPTGGRGLDVPLPDAAPWPTRRREHGDVGMPSRRPVRRQPAEPRRAPVRSASSA